MGRISGFSTIPQLEGLSLTDSAVVLLGVLGTLGGHEADLRLNVVASWLPSTNRRLSALRV